MSLRRIVALAILVLALSCASVPAFAASTGGASAPPASTFAGDDAGSASSGGTSPADAVAAAAQQQADGERAAARARKLARKRAKARARARARARAKARKRRRHTTPPPPVITTAPTPATGSFFPIAGPHTYGGAGSRFGAPRGGHTHGGQDVMAPEGTPLVAPVSGKIRFVANQPSAAGIYIVLSDADGVHEYALMHIQTGSLHVTQGQSVSAGDALAKVGHTGDAEGPHLHFEEWVGPWQTGGHAIDPLPLLQSWDS
ncbi:MAG: hypothetical protein QOD53_2446 [Thermoleophilaceae bacterium]|jgi:murein DD-endopeptidase MepM/ murein hydrolase activator NlpD|nr:hypothetical protein [Thermoleophilaceae bacterium]